MKICLVHEEYPKETNFGGIATYQKLIAEEYVKLGHEVYVICRGLKRDLEYVENGVYVKRIFVDNEEDQVSNNIEYRNRVCNILKELQTENKIEIIEVPDWGAETIFFEETRKIPIVVRLHTPLSVWLKYNKNNFGKVKKLLLNWENSMIKNADLITCCSNALKKIIVKDLKISDSKILVTPNPANIYNFYRDEKITKEEAIVYVGSLEERKGVCILAKALNLVFKKYPILKVRFIGKDTTRNKKNISTKELILSTISKEFKNNIEFIGQIPNEEINHYLNLSRVAVFPSLFDNFPYVVLEAMAVGLHIVGSRNSGMVEILEDEPSIYNTGNYVDLANKIIEKYEISKREEVNYYNINRLKQLYNPKTVSQEMASMYSRTIKEYRDKHITEKDLEKILSKVTKDTEIDSFFREKEGVANYVYQTSTKNNKYIIKKYVYNYDFDLINDMYEIYYNAGIKVAKPLNKEIIKLGDYYYNVFEYIKDANIKAVIDINYLVTLLCCERKTNKSPTLLSKTLKYYNYLKKSNHFSENLKEDIEYTVDVFERVKELDILKEKYLNHGDITLSNILISKKVNYIIDFDEATITTPLYDFAVIIIKMFTKNEIDFKKYKLLRKVLKEKYTNYKNADFDDIVRFYLCKILLEKFYLHISGKINLYSKRQLKDNFRKYIKILKGLEI